MSQPFFSVIIPAHNSEKYIEIGLQSIKNQSFTDYELIVVCDACQDNTMHIAQSYANKLICINKNCSGAARNTGLDHAKGQWILWMDDDDWYLPEAFQKIANAVQDKQLDLLAYGFEWPGVGNVSQKNSLQIAIWNKAWRASFIGSHRFPEWKYSDDWAFANELHPIAHWEYLPEILYHYNFLRAGSISDILRNEQINIDNLPKGCQEDTRKYQQWLKTNFKE